MGDGHQEATWQWVLKIIKNMSFSLAILRKEKKENIYTVILHASEEEASARGILDFLKNTDLRPKS